MRLVDPRNLLAGGAMLFHIMLVESSLQPGGYLFPGRGDELREA